MIRTVREPGRSSGPVPARAGLALAALGALAAVAVTAGCAASTPTSTGPAAPVVPVGSSASTGPTGAADRPCPTLAQWSGALPPDSQGGTPMNTPQAEALAQAVGEEGRSAFTGVYGTLIVDLPAGRVALCLTDPAQAGRLGAAAKRAHPGIDLSRLDVYRCRYTERFLVSVEQKLATKAGTTLDGFPLYSFAPATDDSGLAVTTSQQGVKSAELRKKLLALADGVPVTVSRGSQAYAA
jgi:hypothetical protein